MTGFRDERFPDDIAAGATFGPQHMTEVVTTGSGARFRNQRWSSPLIRADVSTGIKDADDLEDFLDFLHAVAEGQAYSFPFKDFSDYQVAGQALGTGTSGQTQFQLVRTRTRGSFTKSRTIKLPRLDNSTLNIYRDGTLASPSAYTVSRPGGVVTFTAAQTGVVVTADFEFDVPMCFDADYLSANLFVAGGELAHFENIGLLEDRSV